MKEVVSSFTAWGAEWCRAATIAANPYIWGPIASSGKKADYDEAKKYLINLVNTNLKWAM